MTGCILHVYTGSTAVGNGGLLLVFICPSYSINAVLYLDNGTFFLPCD